ncbi:hypothetical protein [Sphingomonas elodea]|uniref:hypothetical protein n=1 Tax=Sphingomonas elodea TaxID=179878 RepID=UPI00111097EB|nr:hypothetical protein [Sphingomonas elodea]
MTHKFVVTQGDVTRRHYQQLDSSKTEDRMNFYDEYRKLNLASSSADYIGTAIGVMAFSDVAKFGISAATVAKYIGGLRNFALTELGVDILNWKFEGEAEEVADYRGWISDGNEAVRKRKVQELLGISERVIYRYIIIESDLSISTQNNIEERFEAGGYRISIVLDALAYANNIKKHRPGVLFSIATEEKSN